MQFARRGDWCNHWAMSSSPNPETVEVLVRRLFEAFQDHGRFEAAEGISAALTFTQRFAKGMVMMSATKEDGKENAGKIAEALRMMAFELEAESGKNTKVH